jgi:hypothetical protein
VIEWRGLDPPFVQDLIDHLRPPANLSVCNGRAGPGDVAITNLREGGLEMAHMFDGGRRILRAHELDFWWNNAWLPDNGGQEFLCPSSGPRDSNGTLVYDTSKPNAKDAASTAGLGDYVGS